MVMRRAILTGVLLASMALAGCGTTGGMTPGVVASSSNKVEAASKGQLTTLAMWVNGAESRKYLAVDICAKTMFGSEIHDSRGGTPIRVNEQEVARGFAYTTPDGKLYLWDDLHEGTYYYLGTLETKGLQSLKYGDKVTVKWDMSVSHFADKKGINPMTSESFFWLIMKTMPSKTTTMPERVVL